MPSTGLKGFTGYTAYTKQGVYATDTTIYANTWYDITNVTGEEQNFLTIYDWSGNYHGTQYIVNKDGSAFTREIESLFEYNGTMYMACFPKDYSVVAEIYALSDVGKAESTIEVRDSNGAVVDGVYTNLASAIAKANELGTATLILKEDVTVGAKQTITGNVTIKDDGTARTITRGAAHKGQMFVTDSSSASLTLQATGTDKDNSTLILDGNGVQKCNAMISLEKSSGTLSVTGPVKFTNAHINQNGGIIRTVSGEASITIDGAVFTGNTVVTETLNGGLINVLGTSKVTIKDTVFDKNVISSSGAVMGAILYVNGGTANVVDSAFTSNITTTTKISGGLLRIDSGTLNIGKYTAEDGTTTVEGACTFEYNSFTASEGGEVYGGVIAIGNNASAQVYNSTFTSNTAEFGNISVNNGATLTIGDSELANNLTTSTTEPDSKDIRATGTSGKVIVEGKVKTTVYCNNSNKLQIGSQLAAGSEITLTGRAAVIAEGNTLVSFTGDNATDVMADCKANGYLKVASEDYTLVYDTTDNTAKLTSVVTTIGEEKYASLEDAITAANALETTAEEPATIVLKANVTVGEMPNITGNVTITDDGTARTITREEGFTNQMFVVADGAGLTFTATGTDKTAPTLTIDGNGAVAGPSGAMVSLGSGSGTLAINNAVQFTNANIKEDGGIIRIEDGSTATVTINGGVFDNNTAEVAGALNGGLIKVVGEAEVTISDALFQHNTIKSTEGALKGGIMYVGGGTVNVVGSTFTSNTVYTKTAGAGGVIAAYGGTVNVGKYVNGTDETVEGACSFTNNHFTGSSYGGAIAVSVASANVYVYNTTIQSNSAYNGGGIHVGSTSTLTVGDSTITDNTTTGTSARTNLNAVGRVELEGKVNASLYCQTENKLHIKNKLSEGSEVKLAWLMTANGIVEGETFVTFENPEVMADCKEKGYIILVDNDYVSSQDHALSYETTSDPQYIAKLTSAVATIGERGYASLADAIEAANALESATIVLKADATVDETQAITGNVTITDDGTARTLTRGAECTAQMFDVQESASLTFAGTGATAEDGTVQGTITVDGNKESVTATTSMINNAGTFSLETNASLTNAGNENVAYGGALYNTGTVALAGTLSGNEGGRGGALYNNGGTVTFSGGEFSGNTASVHGAVIMSVNGTLEITGGTFTSNTANDRGGVILSNGATVTISAGEFSENTAEGTSGGGVFGGTQSAVLEITGGNFHDNHATAVDTTVDGTTTLVHGGGAIESNGKVTISGGTFENNTGYRGGAIYVDDGTKASLTINAGTFNGNTAGLNGGVIFSEKGAIEITNGTFTENTATDRAGVILSKGTVTISGGEFSTNEAQGTTGGGVFGGTGTAVLNITGGSFSNNKASGENAVGGVIEGNGTVIISGGTFEANTAYEGGVAHMSKTSTLTISGGTFGGADKGNTATYRGGVLAIYSNVNVANIDGATFVGNKTSNSKATSGGVIYVADGTTANIGVNEGCEFTSNKAEYTGTSTSTYSYGGCIYLAGTTTDVTVKNTTFTSNEASIGGAILAANGIVKVEGCIFTDNTAKTSGQDIRGNNSATIQLSGTVVSEVALNNTAKILVQSALNADSEIYIRIINTGSITTTTTRDVVEFAEGLMPDASQTIFAMCSAQASKYAMTFASNKLTLSLK